MTDTLAESVRGGSTGAEVHGRRLALALDGAGLLGGVLIVLFGIALLQASLVTARHPPLCVPSCLARWLPAAAAALREHPA